jgi:hypothetical protein
MQVLFETSDSTPEDMISMFADPDCLTASRAIASCSALASIAIMWPSMPTCVAIQVVMEPVPHPISKSVCLSVNPARTRNPLQYSPNISLMNLSCRILCSPSSRHMRPSSASSTRTTTLSAIPVSCECQREFLQESFVAFCPHGIGILNTRREISTRTLLRKESNPTNEGFRQSKCSPYLW